MRKIPTIFERDWDNAPGRVVDRPAAGCEWVFAGEGTPTRKYDGTSCAIVGGVLHKRLALRAPGALKVEDGDELAIVFGNVIPPSGFLPLDVEGEPGEEKVIGWVPVGDGPEDRWHREAHANALELASDTDTTLEDGTFELCGPKVQGNPEGLDQHVLIRHDQAEEWGVDRTYDGLYEALSEGTVEGLVFHHPDGRMAKIKARDFGIKRQR